MGIGHNSYEHIDSPLRPDGEIRGLMGERRLREIKVELR
jgi:hypothetical protein